MEATVIIGIITFAGSILSSFLVARIGRKTARENTKVIQDNNILTQYQGLVSEIQEERTQKTKELDDVKTGLKQMEQRELERAEVQRLRDGAIRRYIMELHQHIYESKPPPPPAWPEGLGD
jgi:hypothetical protein